MNDLEFQNFDDSFSFKKKKKGISLPYAALLVFLASFLGFVAGGASLYYVFPALIEGGPEVEILEEEPQGIEEGRVRLRVNYEEAVVAAVEKASPSVVSIVVTKDVPVIERYYYNPFEEFFGEEFEFEVPGYREGETEKRQVGGGTGFIVSEDGLIVTNKHVVSDADADYTVFTNKGEKYEAEVLDRDPLQDIAILKINASGLPVIELEEKEELKIGQTVIAIGNVLGEFRNSVSVGVVSGLKRDITATGGGMSEVLRGIIQTDAAINSGNSGGPLLNLEGKVVGINTAMATGAENVGFAIPVERAARDIERIEEFGEIVYPFLGIYYTTLTPSLAREYGLGVDYGAWVGRDGSGARTEGAVFPDSPAEEAGLERDDVVLEFGGEKITLGNPLSEIIVGYDPGDAVTIKVFRNGETFTKEATLSKRKD